MKTYKWVVRQDDTDRFWSWSLGKWVSLKDADLCDTRKSIYESGIFGSAKPWTAVKVYLFVDEPTSKSK